MPRPLNLPNMTDSPEADNNPWSDLLWGGGECAVAAYAAHDAVTSLSQSWKDDWAENHRYVLSTLEETIKVLSTYYWALHIVCDHDRLHEDTAALSSRLADGTARPADFDALSKRLEAIRDLKKQINLTDEQCIALVKTAFAPVAERGAA